LEDTVSVLEPVRKDFGWPDPQVENLLSFEELKAGKGVFGRTEKGARGGPRQNPHFSSEKFFRSGKAGGWRNEMNDDIQKLFWKYHGGMMKKLGYRKDGSWVSKPEFDKRVKRLRVSLLFRINQKLRNL
jgi:hypothetical protein